MTMITNDHENEWKWMKIDSGGWKWIKVGEMDECLNIILWKSYLIIKADMQKRKSDIIQSRDKTA